mmetsp:Transcript_22809/g.35488  ORF Transcript_22809/g.35488 Transcript_22809/m.35488 type:complete len:233 (+) Transcript_22809:96-794(+)
MTWRIVLGTISSRHQFTTPKHQFNANNNKRIAHILTQKSPPRHTKENDLLFLLHPIHHLHLIPHYQFHPRGKNKRRASTPYPRREHILLSSLYHLNLTPLHQFDPTQRSPSPYQKRAIKLLNGFLLPPNPVPNQFRIITEVPSHDDRKVETSEPLQYALRQRSEKVLLYHPQLPIVSTLKNKLTNFPVTLLKFETKSKTSPIFVEINFHSSSQSCPRSANVSSKKAHSRANL